MGWIADQREARRKRRQRTIEETLEKNLYLVDDSGTITLTDDQGILDLFDVSPQAPASLDLGELKISLTNYLRKKEEIKRQIEERREYVDSLSVPDLVGRIMKMSPDELRRLNAFRVSDAFIFGMKLDYVQALLDRVASSESPHSLDMRAVANEVYVEMANEKWETPLTDIAAIAETVPSEYLDLYDVVQNMAKSPQHSVVDVVEEILSLEQEYVAGICDSSEQFEKSAEYMGAHIQNPKAAFRVQFTLNKKKDDWGNVAARFAKGYFSEDELSNVRRDLAFPDEESRGLFSEMRRGDETIFELRNAMALTTTLFGRYFGKNTVYANIHSKYNFDDETTEFHGRINIDSVCGDVLKFNHLARLARIAEGLKERNHTVEFDAQQKMILLESGARIAYKVEFGRHELVYTCSCTLTPENHLLYLALAGDALSEMAAVTHEEADLLR